MWKSLRTTATEKWKNHELLIHYIRINGSLIGMCVCVCVDLSFHHTCGRHIALNVQMFTLTLISHFGTNTHAYAHTCVDPHTLKHVEHTVQRAVQKLMWGWGIRERLVSLRSPTLTHSDKTRTEKQQQQQWWGTHSQQMHSWHGDTQIHTDDDTYSMCTFAQLRLTQFLTLSSKCKLSAAQKSRPCLCRGAPFKAEHPSYAVLMNLRL